MTELLPEVAAYVAREISRAGGREVYFVAEVAGEADGRVVVSAKPVARGTIDSVLALPGVAEKGTMVLHNHPSGEIGRAHV